MKNKPIFVIVIILIFGLSVFSGYVWPKISSDTGVGHAADAFLIPPMPQKQTDDFAKSFMGLYAAKEAKFLPDAVFYDIGGKKIKITDFVGKPTLVNFWARWCAPCVVELPSLQKFQKIYDGKINVVAIALEEGKAPQDIAGFLKNRGLGDFAGYVDTDGGVARGLELGGIPTSFLLGKNGQILYRFDGDAEWNMPASTEFFDVFLLQSQ